MSRGRPSKSEIREKITALIERLGFSYGYEIYKHYRKLFGDATSRVIYYHLKKGSELGEFVSVNVKRVSGNYSWGNETERVYYALGPFAKTRQEWWDKTAHIDTKPRNLEYDWTKEINAKINELKQDVKKSGSKEKQEIIDKCDKLIEWCKQKTDKSKSFVSQIKDIKAGFN